MIKLLNNKRKGIQATCKETIFKLIGTLEAVSGVIKDQRIKEWGERNRSERWR